MGRGMAANLARAGYEVAGYDLAAVEVAGVRPAASLEAAVQGAAVVLTMLPDGQGLRAVADDALPRLDRGALFIDCSTVDVESARAVHAAGEERGILCVDAPVSGGSAGAMAGTLTFMAGATAEAFERAVPLFEAMGQKSVHCGAAGGVKGWRVLSDGAFGWCARVLSFPPYGNELFKPQLGLRRAQPNRRTSPE